MYSLIFSYNPELDRWCLVQPMHEKRFGAGVVVVNRLLYAIGGFDGKRRLASVECYHPENNEWSYLQPMSCGRSGAGVATINQFIYSVGGFDGTRQLNLVERYDTENHIWEQMAPIEVPRSALSLTSLDGKLYAIGGFDGKNFLSIVEIYDPKTNTWEKGTQLRSGRSGHASAVIYQPSYASGFSDTPQNEDQGNDDGFNKSEQEDANEFLPFSTFWSNTESSSEANDTGNTENAAYIASLAHTADCKSLPTPVSRTFKSSLTTAQDTSACGQMNESRLSNSLEHSSENQLQPSLPGRVLYVPQSVNIDNFYLNDAFDSRLLKYIFLLSEAIMERCIITKRRCMNLTGQKNNAAS